MKPSVTMTPRQDKDKKTKVIKSSTANKKGDESTQKIAKAFNQAI